MALFLFTKAILEDKPIQVFNNGNMVRDFTYINDIIEGVTRVIDNPPGSHPEQNRRVMHDDSLLKAGVPESRDGGMKGPHEYTNDVSQSSPPPGG
jgi:hypothetical protein